MNAINIHNILYDGNIHKLIKLQKKGYKFDKHAINFASMNGHIHVLELFKNSGNKLKYNKNAIKCSSKYKGTIILKWFKNNNYKTRLHYIKQYKH
jgi:hypothetical protein